MALKIKHVSLWADKRPGSMFHWSEIPLLSSGVSFFFLTKQYRVIMGTMRLVNGHVFMVICTYETNSLTLSANLHAIDRQTLCYWQPISMLLKMHSKDLFHRGQWEHDNNSFSRMFSLKPTPPARRHCMASTNNSQPPFCCLYRIHYFCIAV